MATPHPILQIKRGSTGAPTTALASGELAMDLLNKVLYIGTPASGNLPIAGEGTFATKAYADALALSGSASLASAVTLLQAADAAEQSARIAADNALGLRIDGLGHALNYVGTVSGSALATPTNLSALTQKDAGDYYKVIVDGYFIWTALSSPQFAKAGDAFVKNLNTDDWDLLDHTNSVVQGTLNFIDVTGSQDTGFTIDVDANFKTRVTQAEADIVTLNTTASGLATDIANEVAARIAGDTANASDISALQTRATAIETAATALATRVTAAEADLIAEESARIAADTAEAASRLAGDSALDARVTSLETSIDCGVY
jgi:hypothetical protein